MCMFSLDIIGGGGTSWEGCRAMLSKWNKSISWGTMMNNKGMTRMMAAMYPAYSFFSSRAGISI